MFSHSACTHSASSPGPRRFLPCRIAILAPAVLAVLWLSAVGGENTLAQERPNFVFIMADDLGWADVEFHGGNAPTPNLDRLAASGLELAQHYVAPVCSPTRTGFMTGRYWSRFGVTNPQNERALPWETMTLPRALVAAGYETCLTGKWHLGSRPEWGPNHFGFQHSYGSLAGGVGPWDHFYKKGPFTETWHRNETLLNETGHVTDLIASEAIEWIGKRNDQPFFLYVPFTAVHLPVKEPQEWLDRVPSHIRSDVARQYAACIMHLDDAVGRIVAALDKAGKRDNTLLVFTSDNGGSTADNNGQAYPADDYVSGKLPGNNLPLRGEKGQLYEGGIRVPTVVSWPTRLTAGSCSVPIHITDWMPTFCALAEYDPDPELKWDGTNVWPVLAGEIASLHRTLYWTAPGFRASAVRQGDWKLIVTATGKGEQYELFHVKENPSESQNLASSHTGRVKTLRRQLEEIASSDRDAVAQ